MFLEKLLDYFIGHKTRGISFWLNTLWGQGFGESTEEREVEGHMAEEAVMQSGDSVAAEAMIEKGIFGRGDIQKL